MASCMSLKRPEALHVSVLHALLLSAALLVPGFATAAEADPDLATTRLSAKGLFEVSYESLQKPVQINSMHGWVLHVESADGRPIDDARITISGGMPMHDHGLPTAPEITEALGDGNYQVQGMKFQMTGHWEVQFDIRAQGQSDSVVFNLMLQ